ncbi:MAG: DUF2029 domain-containing protein [Chloroflexi bacterium]|nr:DUF2029 domain-containing protein [Chloroflexota bacterium]
MTDPLDPYAEDEAPPPPMPWRAGAATPSEPTHKVLVEAYDDELPVPTRTEMASAAAQRAWSGVGPATRHAASLVVFALAVIGALAGIGVAWMHVVDDPLADAHAYFEAASRLNAGQPLYPAGVDPSGNHIYLYPPLLAVVLRPLALLPFEAFALVWELVVVASFIALLRYLGVRRRATWLAVGLLGVPIGWALTIAQAHVPMAYLLALGQPWSIALAANLKLTPALIAIWWLGRRDYQSFFAFLLWGALFVAAQLVLEWNGSVAFFGSVGFDQLGHVRNISPYVQSPVLWVVLVLVGALVTLGLARTRWGWAAAVALATLAPPRLLIYMLTGLLAALRQPKVAGEQGPDDVSDPASVYVRSAR